MESCKQKAKVWAVVPAAGSGQRMQSEMPKQYLRIDQKSILEHSLRLLLNQSEIEGMVVCLARDDEKWQGVSCHDNPKITVANGGSSRAKSVMNGIAVLENRAAKDDWILVHDAARPCLKAKHLRKFIAQIRETEDGGIMAVRAKDTLKISESPDNTIANSLDRTNVWQAQTPQMFRFGALQSALSSAIQQNRMVSDEASAMELAGYHPRLIEGDSGNIKITTVDDLKLAEFLINEGKKASE